MKSASIIRLLSVAAPFISLASSQLTYDPRTGEMACLQSVVLFCPDGSMNSPVLVNCTEKNDPQMYDCRDVLTDFESSGPKNDSLCFQGTEEKTKNIGCYWNGSLYVPSVEVTVEHEFAGNTEAAGDCPLSTASTRTTIGPAKIVTAAFDNTTTPATGTGNLSLETSSSSSPSPSSHAIESSGSASSSNGESQTTPKTDAAGASTANTGDVPFATSVQTVFVDPTASDSDQALATSAPSANENGAVRGAMGSLAVVSLALSLFVAGIGVRG